MKSRSFLGAGVGLLGLLFGSALSGTYANPYSPGKHNQRRRRFATRVPGRHYNAEGCKAFRKGVPGVPRGHGPSIGVNGIRGKSGGGR